MSVAHSHGSVVIIFRKLRRIWVLEIRIMPQGNKVFSGIVIHLEGQHVVKAGTCSAFKLSWKSCWVGKERRVLQVITVASTL